MKKIGVREISRKTGYSPATVSNALNHKRNVSKATIERIMEAAQELGYERVGKLSQIVFMLARKSGNVLDEGTFYPGVIEGVEQAARSYGLSINYVTLNLDDRKQAKQIAFEASHDSTNAIVLLATEMDESDYNLFRGATSPLVVIDGWSDRLFFDSIVTSNENSVFRAVDYLISKGHKDIGYIAGDCRIRNFPLRERGYRRAMREHGLPIRPEFRVEVGTTVSSAHKAMKKWLSTRPLLPTAFFIENDIMALGCMRAFNEFNIQIPDDVSIFGFDDLSFASISHPPLTTMHVHNEEMGRLSVEMLMGRMRDPKKYTAVTHLSTDFIERESVKDIR